ncbi:MAG: SDR family oxidoreductase [Chloroflexi bacterium]|nr:SDR family oxidoreductase [Chloroflexota bacterium]
MVITGTSRGIGRQMAEHFVRKGYRVAGCSRSPATLELDGYEHSQLDVSDEKQVRQWVRSINRAHRRIDALVCNAGFVPLASPLTMTSNETLESSLRINVIGTFNVCREVAKVMMMSKSGRIITTSSVAAGMHQEGTSSYSAAKSAIVEATKILAKEVAPLGITCNVIAPSVIATDAIEAMGGEAVKARALESLTIRREVTIEEICNVISFFLSPESGCITGQVIHMGLVC